MTEDAKAAKERYKSTVLLPKTDFPMKAGLQQAEPELQKHWADTDLYGQIRKARAGAKPWVLHDGPPYANGDAHTGTGMNKTLKDMVVRFRTMQGYDSPYVPGWDCHGLPIEHNLLKEMGGKLPEGTSVLELRRQCQAYAEKFIDIQRKQFQRVGVLGRWDNPYLTMNPSYEAAALGLFRNLVERGYMTRALRPVHWSWAAQSALAEAELEYEDREDLSVYVRYMLTKGPADVIEKPTALLIWTTTPWTLPANRAVAVHRDAEYALIEYGNGERMVLAEELREAVAAKTGLGEHRVLRVMKGRELENAAYTHAMWGTECPVVHADYVTLEDGTGLVHTAPGHGKEDFETGKQYGIAAVCPVSANGTYYAGERLREELRLPEGYNDANDWLAFIEGKLIWKANDGIAEKLREQGLLLHSEKFSHSYPHCWRTHTPVIFRVTDQWFVQVDHVDPDKTLNPEGKPLRARILDEIEASRWFPAWGKKRISAMVENRPDWCVSRQRYWGIPIPAFEDAETGEVVCDLETLDHVIDLVREHGSNVWFDDENWPAEKLVPAKHRGRKLAKLTDIFDVWFEAGSSFAAVMRTDPELKDKGLARDDGRAAHAGMYLEGDDQHRGWFQVSLILSVATTGVSPFRDCLTSAFVVDEKGEKGSKSKGNIWALDKGCEDLGADLIRFYFASVNTSDPIPVTYKLIQGHGEAYRKVRNTYRALVGNLFDFDPAKDAVEYKQLLPLDRWALSRCAKLVEDVTAAWERYEFHTAMRAVFDFANVTLSSQYIDTCKDRLYCEDATGVKRRSAQTAYHVIADTLVRLLAPILVHTTEEMWRHLPGMEGSVHLTEWPRVEGLLRRDEVLDARFRLLLKLKSESDRVLDRLRKEKVLGKGYDANVVLGLGPDLAKELAALGTPEELAPELAETLNVSGVKLDAESDHGALQEFEPATDVKGLWLKVLASEAEACVRCYRRTGDVGTVADHPHLCTRCAEVVKEGT